MPGRAVPQSISSYTEASQNLNENPDTAPFCARFYRRACCAFWSDAYSEKHTLDMSVQDLDGFAEGCGCNHHDWFGERQERAAYATVAFEDVKPTKLQCQPVAAKRRLEEADF